MKKIFLWILLFIPFSVNANENLTYIDLKDLNNLSNQENIVRTMKISGAMIRLKTENIEKIFFYPPKKFITKATYTGIFDSKISHSNSKFMEDWLESKYLNVKEINTEDDYVNTTLTSLTTQQFNLFYNEVVLLSGGRRYTGLIQKHISDKLRQQKSNKEYIFEFIVLGYDKSTDNSYMLITNFDEVDDKKIYKEYNIIESDYINARKAVENKQYDFAMSKMDNLIKKYSNNTEYKKDYCNIMLTKTFKLNSKIPEQVINCYKNILKYDDSAEVNYILATIYYNNYDSNKTVNNQLIIDYTTKAINLINTEKSDLTPREAEVYHNSLYLRGTTKINMKDESGYDDLRLLEEERQDLFFDINY